MVTISQSSPVLVTGGSGYIASWIISFFLDEGFAVRTTVRDKSKTDKVSHLNDLSDRFPGKLEFFEADLLQDGSFKAAMEGCELVVHTASPFFTSGIKDPQRQLIEPALQGTKNVLQQVNATKSVKRVVLTSSVVAIYGDAVDIRKTANGVFTEEDWNFSSTEKHQPYSYSKTLAEKEAWAIARAQDRWDLVVINPGFVLGPSLSTRSDSTSTDFMISMIGGKFKSGVPALSFGVVDVRDVAYAHVLAGTKSSASGRHILVADTFYIMELATLLRERYQDRFKLPTMTVPKVMSYLVGPFFGLKWRFIKRNVGIELKFDNRRSIKDLGVQYRPIAETLSYHAEQLVRDGLVRG